MKKILQEALSEYRSSVRRGEPDAKHLQRTENNIRRNYNKILLNTAVRYGNTETKRKRRREDRKYFNRLADYFGARIRDLGASNFPFPSTMRTTTSSSETVRLYPGTKRLPTYRPRHVMPELDFVDMIRSHGLELVRQCMKYSVPPVDARRYLDNLIERLTDYLLFVYTEGKTGKKDFVHGGAAELRDIVTMIQAQYHGMNGRPPSITQSISASDRAESGDKRQAQDDELDVFFLHLAETCNTEQHPEWEERAEQLRTLVEKGILRRDDVEYIRGLLLEDTRMMGSAFHDFIANSTFNVRPFSLYGPVRHGDKMVLEQTEFMITSEVTVADGRGRLDILVFRRTLSRRIGDPYPETVWEPFILLEVKTKCFYTLHLYGVATKSKDQTRRVMEPVIGRRRAQSREWEDTLNSTPSETEVKQLQAYERAVLEEYRRIAPKGTKAPEQLMKGVLVVDMKESWSTVRDTIPELIEQVYEDYSAESGNVCFDPTIDGESVNAGIVMFSDCEKTEPVPLERTHLFNPFSSVFSKREDNEFVLYLTVAGRGSSAESAARISERWLGLEYVYASTKGKHCDIVWLDFAGEYEAWEMGRARSRLTVNGRKMLRFLRERVSYFNLSDGILMFLKGSADHSESRKLARKCCRRRRKSVVVVTGTEHVRRVCPKALEASLDDLLLGLMEELAGSASIIWFGRPRPLALTSERYGTRSLTPFYEHSPMTSAVNRIVYNIPLARIRSGSHSPSEDDIRLIATETPERLEIGASYVPVLFRWGEQFRPDSIREDNLDKRQIYHLSASYSTSNRSRLTPSEEEMKACFLDLFPHLARYYVEAAPSMPSSLDGRDLIVKSERISAVLSKPKSLLARVVLEPYQYQTASEVDGRVKRLEPLSSINHPREYRKSGFLTKPPKVTTRPPDISLLTYHESDDREVARKEMRSLRRTIRYLKRIFGDKKSWQSFLDSLESLIDENTTERHLKHKPLNLLRNVARFLQRQTLSKKLWDSLFLHRLHTPTGMSADGKKALQRLVSRNADLLRITGNHLFLLLLAGLEKSSCQNIKRSSTQLLWDYLIPFHLLGLGFQPEYSPHHRTGKSVIHRPKLIGRLARRAESLATFRQECAISSARFGVASTVSVEDSVPHLHLTFQSRAGLHEMSTIFVPVMRAEDSISETLVKLPKNTPFWGANDIIRIASMSERGFHEDILPIMVAEQGGETGLWYVSRSGKKWIPVGQLDYYSRRREGVTLLISIALRQNPELCEVEKDEVRELQSRLGNHVQVALETLRVAYYDCVKARVRVGLDREAEQFRLVIQDCIDDSEEVLLIEQAHEVIDVLRRPDLECEPVSVRGKRFVWNRFNDVSFEEDTMILKPYVLRQDPYRVEGVSFPPTASKLVDATRGDAVWINVEHDNYTCPLMSQSPRGISSDGRQKLEIVHYLREMEWPEDQPDRLFEESNRRHGACWKMEIESKKALPSKLAEIDEVRYTGPALAALLKTGLISYETAAGDWMIHRILPTSKDDLPLEFRESFHLLPLSDARAAYPGQALLDSWKAEIKVMVDRIVFRLFSRVTGEEVVYTMSEPHSEFLEKERFRQLLEEGGRDLLQKANFEDLHTIATRVQAEIDEHIALAEESEDVKMKYDSVEIVRQSDGSRVVVAIFTTQDGDSFSLQVSQPVGYYLGWNEMGVPIGIEILEEEVSSRLDGRYIEQGVKEEIVRGVREALTDCSVRIHGE